MILFAELQRRNVIRMAGLYLVGAWLIVQVTGTVLPMFEVPGWVARAVVIALVIGFVPALAFAWIFELTAEGIKRDAQVHASESIAPQTAQRMNRLIIAVLALALVYFSLDKFVLEPRREAAVAAQTAAAPPPAENAQDGKSIAVLAFTDLSPEQDSGYFSDGIAEEILNALVRIKDLKVAGRTSSFYYKGRNEDLRGIGKALGVAHVLEGSVRRQGDRVRITAQLIRASDGFHLWSDTYDGELTDVFALQDQIARAITGELKVVLEAGQQQRLVVVATSNAEAYALYLRATEVLNKRDYPAVPQAISWLEKAIALDSKFARGEAQLALLHVVGNRGDPRAMAKAEKHARRAIALDPTQTTSYYALGIAYREQRRYVEARQWLDKADALQRGDASASLYLAQWLIVAGYTRQGVERLDRALALDPMLPNALNWRAYQYLHAGEVEAAEAMFLRAKSLGLTLSRNGLAEVARARGDFSEVRRLMANPLVIDPTSCLKSPATGYPQVVAGGAGGTAAEQARALELVDECLAAHPRPLPSWLPSLLMRLHQPERALDLLSRQPTSDDAGVFGFRLWGPLGREMRRLPQFPAAAEKIGFVDAWEKYGKPDLCKRAGARQWTCE